MTDATMSSNNNHNKNIMKTTTKHNGSGYMAPTFEITSVAAEAGFCYSGDATLNGFNDPETVDLDFGN